MTALIWACCVAFVGWLIIGLIDRKARALHIRLMADVENEKRLQALRDAAGIDGSGPVTEKQYRELLALMLAFGEVNK